ncbi:YvcK family protein [Candidatus Microgenomates bacterium]|nr:YvcK family protein [Candidatus Microgenomates bacterium]
MVAERVEQAASPEKEYRYHQKIVVLGGGGGQFNVLRGLRKLNPPELITSLSTTLDSGGSSGRFRSDLGLLPMGDEKQSLIAFLDDEQQQEAILLSEDRFNDVVGPMKGHDFFNILIQRLEHIHGGREAAIEAFKKLFKIRGNVMTSTMENRHLIAKCQSGLELLGEEAIDQRWQRPDFDPSDKIIRIYLNAPAQANPKALAAISLADKIVFSSGSLWGSTLPHFLINGIPEVIKEYPQKPLIYVANLATERGQTDFYKLSDHIERFVYYLGDPHRLNYLIVNENHFDPDILAIYQNEGQYPVELDEERCREICPTIEVIKANLAAYLPRDRLLRHDADKIAEIILSL